MVAEDDEKIMAFLKVFTYEESVENYTHRKKTDATQLSVCNRVCNQVDDYTI